MISKQEPRVLIVDGENLVQSPHLKEVNEVEKDDVKKKLPTILDIVLRPELFDNATYLSEGVDGRKRIISNEIKDEEDYYDDGEAYQDADPLERSAAQRADTVDAAQAETVSGHTHQSF